MKTIETKMPFCTSVSRWARLWVLAFAMLLAAYARPGPTVWAQSIYESYAFTNRAWISLAIKWAGRTEFWRHENRQIR